MRSKILLLLIPLFVLHSFSFSQVDSPQTSPITPQSQIQEEVEMSKPVSAGANSKVKDFRTKEENSLTILFVGFSLVVLIMACILLTKFSQDCNVAFKYFIIVLLIMGMLILIPVGYNNEQISPAVGLFGTIAGYLLGKTESSPKKEPPIT